MSCCTSSGCGCTGCKLLKILVALFLTLATFASLIGTWNTHFLPEGLVFGTPNGSLALLVFIVSLVYWLKSMKSVCPCYKSGCCGPEATTTPKAHSKPAKHSSSKPSAKK